MKALNRKERKAKRGIDRKRNLELRCCKAGEPIALGPGASRALSLSLSLSEKLL